MADSKISELSALTSPANDDEFVVVDTDAGTTKRITFSNLNTAISSVATSIAADNITTGDAAVTIATSSGNITIDAQAGDTDIIFKGTDNTSDITALTLDMSEAGAAAFNSTVTATGFIIGSASIDETELEILDGATLSTTELNYVDGVTSAIQTQLDAKQATITGSATTIDTESLTASRAVISNGSQKIAVSATTDTELGYVSGVTSAIQTQLNTKAHINYNLTKTANYTAVAGDKILCDTSGGAFTITLPASPSAGDEVHVLDATASFDSNNLTVGRNSKKIQGATNDLTITTQNTGIGLVFYNDTYGWRVLVDAYDVDVTEL